MATRHVTCLLLCLVGVMTLLSVGCTGCRIGLHEGTRANVTQAFARRLKRGNTVVRFHLYLRDNATTESVSYKEGLILSDSTFPSFGAKGNDTFAPYLWLWARENGKYILRVPLDFHLLSLGIISLYIADMEVPIVTDDLNCTNEIPYSEVQNMIATLLYDEVIHAGDTEIVDDVICRSAYAMEYYLSRVVGVKGCDRNPTTGNFSCESFVYMKGWEMTWFGPDAIIICFYIFIALTIYKEYITYKDLRGKDKDLRIKMNIIEQKILRDVKRIRRQIYGAPVEDNFISYLDQVYFLDVLGVSQKKQDKVIFAVQVIISIVLLVGYYGIMGYSIYYHGLPRQRKLIELIQNSREMYANVFSHLAWLYTTDSNPSLKTYALVEACFTGLIPLVMIFLIKMFTAATRDVQIILPKKKAKGKPHCNDSLEPATSPPDINTIELDLHTSELDIPKSGKLCEKETKKFGVGIHYTNWFHAFAVSMVARILFIILGFVVIVFWLLIGGVYMIYSLYMIGVGAFLTLNLFAGWMLPACLSIYYAYDVFTPLFDLYTVSKNAIFKEINKRKYLVKTDEYMLAPTSIIEKFYYTRSRGQVFEGFQRVFVALSLLLMLFLIFIASQYPDFDIRSKNSNLVMGVNIAIILPFLASMMQTRTTLTDFEKEVLSKDIQDFLDDWEAENAVLVEALKIRVQKLEKKAAEKEDHGNAAANNPDAPGSNGAGNGFDDSAEEALEMVVVDPANTAAKDAKASDPEQSSTTNGTKKI